MRAQPPRAPTRPGPRCGSRRFWAKSRRVRRCSPTASAALVLLLNVAATLAGRAAPPRDSHRAPIDRVEAAAAVADQELMRLRHERLRSPEADAVFADGAAAAWRFAAGHIQPATGLI